MNILTVKNVDVMGDQIKAAKDTDGNIWVGVRWICDALEMTEGQRKRQIKNIQKDMVFEDGGSNQIPIPTNNGIQEVFCIRNDFIPLWLAKISITEKTRQERPEFSKKLLKYQLQAKDILAEAFIEKKQKTQTAMELLELHYEALKEVDGKVTALSDDLSSVRKDFEDFKQDMPILGIEEDKITNAVKKKGVECLDGKKSNAYKNRSLRVACTLIYMDNYGDSSELVVIRQSNGIRLT